MEVRNRLSDVKALKTHILQDYLKLIIIPGWQKPFYRIAEDNSASGCQFRGIYHPIYRKMREVGVDNYTIDMMDVTIISQILNHEKSLHCFINKHILDQLHYVKSGRNVDGHPSANEPEEELYLFGIMELVDLRIFVECVDEYSKKSIDDDTRLEFLQKYTRLIDDLKNVLDNERIQLIQKHKEMDDRISEVLASDDPLNKWNEVIRLYNSKRILDKDWNEFMEFYIRASNAGIPFAHVQAARHILLIDKDYAEAERHFLMITEKSSLKDQLIEPDVREILAFINSYISQGNEETEGMKKLIDFLNKMFVVEFSDGHYSIPIIPPAKSDDPFNNSIGTYARRQHSASMSEELI